MSEEREVIRLGRSTPSGTIALSEAKELHKQETGESLEENFSLLERKARIARVLERGVTADRLAVDLPDGLYGEWVPRDLTEIDRKKLLGFRLDDEYAKKRSLHSLGDGSAVVGDVVFMVTTRENKELIDLVKRERFERLHGSFKKKRGPQVEEKAFADQVRTRLGEHVPVIDESEARPAGKEEIEAALKEDDLAAQNAAKQ